ncbi:outer membrane beta-barrel protein [Ferruginibacter albus]|uniref:outer membrane beta-barrel protein n=1 Tax=Ferruginibacter albus TaxID=2875540 RepID=UPI001CC3E717|nr:outer membrane beta-barrel protein [Ferruginibacter albus]UAY52042.1 PorT family protein [Ferruginibacter albus]
MKKIFSVVLLTFIVYGTFAQTTTITKKTKPKIDIADRAADHLMIDLTTDHWTNMPDTISNHQKGFSRGFSIYYMFDKPFKTSPNWSVAFGLGISNSNIFFDKMSVGLNATGAVLPFQNLDSSNHFDKYKLSTTFVEVPVELRFTKHPENNKKSFKAALGAKVGLMLNAHTKGVTEVDKYGNLVNDFTEKISNTAFFNGTRLTATARVGYGSFSLYGSYQITSLLKDGAGPDIKFFQIGVCLSGL